MSGLRFGLVRPGTGRILEFTHMKTMLFGAAIVLLSAASASAEVQLTLQNGRVTIVAKDASVRQILTEWARVGKTKIVNVEKIPGAPMTIELRNMPESQALEILMRTLSGYITAPRPVEAANLSQFDRIIVMPTIASARPASAAPPPPVFQQQTPQFTQPPLVDDDADDERPAPNVAMPATIPANMAMPPNVNRGPVFNSTAPRGPEIAPQGVMPGGLPPGFNPNNPNQQVPQQQVPTNTVTPTAPFGGVAVPGMIVAPPPQQPGQQPGQIQQPQQQQPGQPVRRPGGN
jgi:hypothetical protein